MKRIAFIVALNALTACSGRKVEQVVIKGSDTEVNAVLQIAEVFMAQDPAVSVSITGGGSGVGIAALLNGKTDIANSSREINAQELVLAERRGLRPVAHVLAGDALVIVTHPSVGIDSLTFGQLAALFAGEIRDWQQLGGRPGPVSLYGRQSNSGTFIYFRDQILGRDFSAELKQMNGSAQIVEAVRNDAGAIGYVGLGYAFEAGGQVREGLRLVRLSPAEGRPAVSPVSREALRDGRYPLIRPLIQYTAGEPSGKVRAFLAFEQSEAGRAIIAANGYLPLTPGMFAGASAATLEQSGIAR